MFEKLRKLIWVVLLGFVVILITGCPPKEKETAPGVGTPTVEEEAPAPEEEEVPEEEEAPEEEVEEPATPTPEAE